MQHRHTFASLCLVLVFVGIAHTHAGPASTVKRRLRVVATLPDYGMLARAIGGDRVIVDTIVRGDQDAHFIRPKPSFVDKVKKADLLIATGLDLELWLPTVVNKSGNRRVRSGEPGYVAAAHGMHLLEKPKNFSRIEGGVHVYGNPHVTCSPVNMKVAARNIADGLIANDPEDRSLYERNLKTLLHRIDVHLFGEQLVKLLGGDTLCGLAEKGRLLPFIEKQSFKGKPLIDSLGGWMKAMMPFRGVSIVTYHKNWVYFLDIFGIRSAGTIEVKPGIPPTPRHVAELVETMRRNRIRIILAANFFDAQKVRTVADRVNAVPVIVPVYVGGEKGVTDYFKLVDLWVARLLAAGREAEVLKSK